VEHKNAKGGVNRSLRFKVNGERQSVALGEVSRAEAETRLRQTMADVERGIWEPEDRTPPPSPGGMPTFDAFAERWWTIHRVRLSKGSQVVYRTELKHLKGFFGWMRLDDIVPETIRQYQAAKLKDAENVRTAAASGKPLMEEFKGRGGAAERRRRPLSAGTINGHTILLAEILEVAVEDKLITCNYAKGKKRRLKEEAPYRPYLERPAEMEALLKAAGELDREGGARGSHYQRRPMIATLMFAGLRISEELDLQWPRINLASGYLRVGKSKTDASSYRQVRIRGGLRDELGAVKAQSDGEGFVFVNRSGRPITKAAFDKYRLQPAVRRANENLAAEGLPPLPEKLTSHFGRRTFVTNCVALGVDIGTCMDETGHTDARFTLRVYRQPSRLSTEEKAALRKLVEGEQVLADIGINADEPAPANDPRHTV